uniref:DNA ligase n=1 Tax=Phthorimaea operculella granulovirus TaxID=192584 RepID=A0A481SD25_9BBAC|nr:DNA ligase [Phthorimaea operculella granulovirus]QBH66337.1 DNA ligase [Phthorimaea operculella granulovirus]QBH66467.1 DNA ligase [Phthorimaea operculella granulovirus]QBH66597.1 DNA ligase [Phthorimaea operculella granulovirus]
MLFTEFAFMYEKVMSMKNVHEINVYMNKRKDKTDALTWLYLVSTFYKKFCINDKHLLTIFSKLCNPVIDRRNLHEAFKKYGVAQMCSNVAPVSASPSSLTMAEVYVFLQQLEKTPCKTSCLLSLFKNFVPRCDRNNIFTLVNIVRSAKNKKMLTKKRNLYFFRQMFGKKNTSSVNVNINLTNNTIDLKFDNSITQPVIVCDYINPGKPLEPMLAQPCKNLNSLPFNEMCIEIKYDGERVQLHKTSEGTICCYKRNLNVHTKCNEIVNSVCKRVLHNVDNCILDCELIQDEHSFQLLVFDVMYFNNECLIDKPLFKRKQILDQVMCHEEDGMRQLKYIYCNDKTLVGKWLRETLQLNNLSANIETEGVVIKNWHGVYEPKRKKWCKIKRAYFKNVCSADLVVVGGWKDDTKKRITIYLVATPFYDIDSAKWMFLPVSKVKYSKNNYEHYMREGSADWLVCDDYLKHLGKVPDMVAVDPLSMPVWEMEGDFIRSKYYWQHNNICHNYVSIRLPRFIRVRDDKSFKDANTIFDLILLSSITNKSYLYPELYEFFLKENIKNLE